MEEKQNEREYKRHQIIENAVRAADKIIMDGSDGIEEETNYLTAVVAKKLVEMALSPFQSELLSKDIKEGL